MNERQVRNKLHLFNKCNLLIKSRRINDRIDKYSFKFIERNTHITKDDFKKFVKDIEIMIAQELTDKPREPQYDRCFFSGKAKDFNPAKWQKIETTKLNL